MSGTLHCGIVGGLSWDGVLTRLYAATKTTVGGGYRYQKNCRTSARLLSTACRCQQAIRSLKKSLRSTGSTTSADTKKETCASCRENKTRRTRETPSVRSGRAKKCVRLSGPVSIPDILRMLLLGLYSGACRLRRYCDGNGQTTGVYDLVNAGPNHRFTTAAVTAHNCLGLGYGCGSVKFQSLAEAGYGIEMSADQAAQAVAEYRGNNPKVTAYWRDHQMRLKLSVNHSDPTHEILLPSGRVLTYYEPRHHNRDVVVKYQRDGNFRKCYGGLLTENTIQATARDILCDAWRGLHASGIPVLWTVHDEFIIEAPEDEIEDVAAKASAIMISSSPWAEGCPIEVEYQIADHYCK